MALSYASDYSVDGRVFAYRAKFRKANIREDGSRVYLGAEFILYFYDEDGDGTFETRYTG